MLYTGVITMENTENQNNNYYAITIARQFCSGGNAVGEILAEKLPGRIQHLRDGDVDVNGQKFAGVVLGVGEAAVVIVGEVKTVLQFGLGVLCIGIESHGRVHHLAVVLARFLVLHQLLQSGQGAERVDDHFSGVRIGL